MMLSPLLLPMLLLTCTANSAPTVTQCSSASYCPATCSGLPGNASTYVPMSGTEHKLMGNTTGELQLQRSTVRMVNAVEKQFGPVTNNMAKGLHLSFQYLCCTNYTERARMEEIMAAVRWHPIKVRFTRIVCAASMALGLADPAAQGALFGVVSMIEEALANAGLGPRVRFRAEQAPFHVSLFNAEPLNNTHNISDLIALAQSTFASSGSLNVEPIVVDVFEFNGKKFHAVGGDDNDGLH